jgi:magnesium transporter
VEPIKKFELSKEYLERLQTGIDASDTAYILDSLDGVNVADIAAILDELDTSESLYVLRLIEGQLAADTLIELSETTLEKVLQDVETKEIASWIELMDSDDGADIISFFFRKRLVLLTKVLGLVVTSSSIVNKYYMFNF